jgi:hypothetical protein
MKNMIIVVLVTAVFLSGCMMKKRPPVMRPTPGGSYVITKGDILAAGGRCAVNLCTEKNGQQWDCSGGGSCSKIESQ